MKARPTRTCSRGRPWSPSWATSTTARHRCSTPIRRDQRHGAGSRRHHATHRRLQCRRPRATRHLPRHPRPRGLHGHAGARRQGDRHRRAGRGCRRRRDAADRRGHQPRARRRRPDHRRHQQDRQARRQRRAHQAEPGRLRPGCRGLGRRHHLRAGVGEDQGRYSAPPRNAAPAGRRARAEGQPGQAGTRHHRRSQARSRSWARWPRCWCRKAR